VHTAGVLPGYKMVKGRVELCEPETFSPVLRDAFNESSAGECTPCANGTTTDGEEGQAACEGLLPGWQVRVYVHTCTRPS
jgi:hypothetical protein